MHTSVISVKGQITLPKPIRKALGVKAGDEVRFLVVEDEVRIMPVRPIQRLFGALKREGPVVSLEEMDEATASGACAP